MTDRWERCRDVIQGGQDAVRGHGGTYLAFPEGLGLLSSGRDRYLRGADLYGAAARTQQGLAATMFAKPITTRVPKGLETRLGDITLTGDSLDTFGLSMAEELLTVGRVGVVVDLPAEPSGNPRPYVTLIRAENILNWRTRRVGGVEVPVLVVIAETVSELEGFRVRETPQIRVLRLDEDGHYIVDLWRKGAPGVRGAIWDKVATFTPTRRDDPLGVIPVVVCNATGCGFNVTKPPLLDLVDVNLSHYQASAELSWARWHIACPTAVISGYQPDADGKLAIGSASAWVLPPADAKAYMLEVHGKGLEELRLALSEKEQKMQTLGSRLLEAQPRANETASAVLLRHASDHATLRRLAKAESDALTRVLRIVSWWAGFSEQPDDPDVHATVNEDYHVAKLPPDELNALMALWQSGGISFDTLHWNLRRGEIIPHGRGVETERHLIQADSDL